MEIKDLFKFKKARKFIEKLRMGGESVYAVLFTRPDSNMKNTINGMLKVYRNAHKAGATPAEFNAAIAIEAKLRKRSFLNTIKNTMLATRQEMTNRLTRNIEYYVNYGSFDSKQTKVCGSYLGKEWRMKWSKVPSVDKPPRTSGAFHNGVYHHPHRCRSRIIPAVKGKPLPDSRDAMTQFNDMPDSDKRELLRKKVYKAYKSGDIQINTVKQLEDARLVPIKKLLK